MQQLSTLFFLFTFITIQAQQWADSSATWHYSFGGIASQGYVSIEYSGDTLVLGIEAKKMTLYKSGFNFVFGETFDYYLAPEFTYSDSDHVYHKVGDEFKILYDFSAQVGDTLVHYLTSIAFNPVCDTFGRSVVSETGVETINGIALRWYETEYIDGISAFDGKIYEKLGAIDFMFPTNELCGLDDDYYGPLRCYSDENFGEYSNPNYSGDCEFIYYFPIPNYFGNNPEWCVTQLYGVGDDCLDEFEMVHYINGQEIIDSVLYYKLFTRGVHTSTPNIGSADCSVGNPIFDYLEVYIRQEGEKIFIISMNSSTEYLLYDFSLSIGDTVASNASSSLIFPDEIGPFVITDIDSVYLYDNFYKRFYFEVPNGPISEIDSIDYFMEGIGHFQGFIYPFEFTFESSHFLHAFNKNGIPYYEFPEAYGTCDFTVSVEERMLSSFSLDLHPNPVSDQLFLNFSEAIKLRRISIYTISGQMILTQNPSTSSGRHTVDLSQLQSGMYLLEVESTEGYREVKRFVVE
jgi:hypothetical protein